VCSGALAVGARGTITGLANIFPRLCVHLFNLYHQSINSPPSPATSIAEALRSAQKLQGEISACEWYMLSGGIPSIKYACKKYLGRGGIPRRPVPESSEEVKKRIDEGLKPLMEMELKLENGATSLV